MTEDKSLMVQQLELEAEATDLGIERYREMRAADEATLPPGMLLMRKAVQPTADAITDYLKEYGEGKAGMHAHLVSYLEQFSPDTLAYITAKWVVRSLCKPLAAQNIAMSITGMLEDTLNYNALKAEAPHLYKRLMEKIKKSANPGYRHIVMRRQQKYANVRVIKWGLSERLKLGMMLLKFMEGATGMFTIKSERQGRKNLPAFIVGNPETLEWFEQSHRNCELLSPFYLPTVVPPREWTNVHRGGYYTKPLRLKLVKTSNRAYLEEMKSWTMPDVYAAVNAIQNTAWRINAGVFSVMREVWERGGDMGGLPPRDNLPMPADAPKGASDDQIKESKRRKAEVHVANMRLISKRMAMTSKLWVAEKFQKDEAIYFVHNLDWRGRAYALASYVNPQGDDSGRALLQFGTGVKLGTNGAYWLAVHGANCYGVDKGSFDERAQWVEEHTDAILDSALKPLDGERFWTEADGGKKSYSFLAFCLEWASLQMHVNAGGAAEDFVSHLPVSWDGTCNGLQNYSMMMRDEVGGKATNLLPSSKPSDIYAEVAKVASERAKRDASSNEVAASWAGKIDRTIAKRPTMTLPYGAGKFGMKDQLIDTLKKIEDKTRKPYLDGDKFKACLYMADVMHSSIGQVVSAARVAMDWLQGAARVVGEARLPIIWDTPSGMRVMQDYRSVIGKRIDAVIAGERMTFTLTVEGDALDKKKQTQGIAPNFVHSLDASHMVRTVQYCVEQDVHAYAMIHDSFGTHAGHADTLHAQLRRAFVDQYTPDVLGDFRQQIVNQLPKELAEKIPPCPAMGSLEVTAVLDSDYFFA